MFSRKVSRFFFQQRQRELKTFTHEECKQQHWIIVAQFTENLDETKQGERKLSSSCERAEFVNSVNLSEKNRGRRFESTHNVDSESIWKDRKEKFSCWVDWLNKCMGKLHDKAFLSDHRLIFRLNFTIVVSMGLLAGERLVTQDPHRHWKLSRSALGWESKKLKNSFTKNFVVINAPWKKTVRMPWLRQGNWENAVGPFRKSKPDEKRHFKRQ